jgi:hypothetical protein
MAALNSKRVWQGVAAVVDFSEKIFRAFCSNGACKGLKALNAPSPGEASIPFFLPRQDIDVTSVFSMCAVVYILAVFCILLMLKLPGGAVDGLGEAKSASPF